MMIEDFISYISNLDWVQVIGCTIILSVAAFVYLYHKRGRDFWYELCNIDNHTYNGSDVCMVCGQTKKDDPTYPAEHRTQDQIKIDAQIEALDLAVQKEREERKL